MKDLKIDDLLDITIKGARVMYTTPDTSQSSHRLTTVIYGGTRYVLIADPESVSIARPEVDEVAEPTTAVAEPVISDDARTILDGLNARLDDRCDPVLGIDWAIRQPEVASADGPNVEGEYQVELADFTLIGWQPAERAWAVTVSDDIEGGVSR